MATARKGPSAAREDRRKRVYELLLAGRSYSEIATAVGVTKSTVARDVKLLLDQLRADTLADAEAWRRLQVAQIDRGIAALWEGYDGGDLATVDRMLRLLERKAKLLGLDAPTQVVTAGTVTYNVDPEVQRAKVRAILDESGYGDGPVA